MKSFQKALLVLAALGLLIAVGCKQTLDLSMQRNRIFLMGRLLVGQTCDVRLIWRQAPNDPVPVKVTADLSEIGGDAEQELMAGDNGTWRWSGQVTPDVSGERLITITAFDDQEEKNEVSKRFRVFTTDRTIALAVCYDHLLALKANGTVAAAGCDDNQGCVTSQCNVPANLTDAVAIAGWDGYSLALKQDGTVAIWGRIIFRDPFYDNQCWNMYVPSGLADVVAITAGTARTNALKADGTVVEWGCEPYLEDGVYMGPKCGMHNVPAGLTDVVAIAAGPKHSLALKADGTVVAWGDNGNGQCDVPILLRGVVALAGDDINSLALKDNGEVVSWGFHKRVPVRIGREFKAIAAYDTNIGLREDGTVVAWWDENIIAMPLTPDYVVRGLKNIIAITYNMALTEDGSVIGFSPQWDGFTFWAVPDELK